MNGRLSFGVSASPKAGLAGLSRLGASSKGSWLVGEGCFLSESRKHLNSQGGSHTLEACVKPPGSWKRIMTKPNS